MCVTLLGRPYEKIHKRRCEYSWQFLKKHESKRTGVTLAPWYQSRVNVWPIHLNFLFFISKFISSCAVTFHRSLLEIICGHHILNIYLRHHFTNSRTLPYYKSMHLPYVTADISLQTSEKCGIRLLSHTHSLLYAIFVLNVCFYVFF